MRSGMRSPPYRRLERRCCYDPSRRSRRCDPRAVAAAATVGRRCRPRGTGVPRGPCGVAGTRPRRGQQGPRGAGRAPAYGTRNWSRGVPIAAAAVLVAAIGLTLVNRLRERGAPQAAAPIASTLFVTSEVVFQHDGQARAGRVGEELTAGTRITTYGGRAAIVLANGIELRLDSNTAVTLDTQRSMSVTRGAVYLDSSRRTG